MAVNPVQELSCINPKGESCNLAIFNCWDTSTINLDLWSGLDHPWEGPYLPMISLCNCDGSRLHQVGLDARQHLRMIMLVHRSSKIYLHSMTQPCQVLSHISERADQHESPQNTFVQSGDFVRVHHRYCAQNIGERTTLKNSSSRIHMPNLFLLPASLAYPGPHRFRYEYTLMRDFLQIRSSYSKRNSSFQLLRDALKMHVQAVYHRMIEFPLVS